MSLTYDVLKDDVRAGKPIDFGFVTYVPERTYHPKRISTAYHSVIVCSECKHRLDEVTIYCPNCGARLEGVGR